MFGNRPSLFNTSNTSFGSTGIGFGANAASTPFGAGATGTAFGATNTFGAQPAQTGGLFGTATNTATGTGGLFGGGTSVFGQPAQQAQQSSAFTFGAVTATVASTAQPAAGGGLFGAAAPTAFGTAQPQQSALFGAGTTNTFGATATPSASTGLFGGGTAGGFLTASASATAGSGTTVKFVPITGTDVVMKGGAQSSVTTKLQCITGMKEYETKSLEELRMEDYVANRKGPQQGSVGFGFGASVATTQATTGFSSFGAAKPATGTFGGFGTGATGTGLFGSTQQPVQQSVGSSLFGGTTSFGAAKPLFGTATTTAASTPFGGLSTAGAGTTLFGQASQNKSIFGATATAQPSNMFGATQPTATPAFGTGAFGSATNTAFGTTATSTGGLFGAAKPAAFGQQTGGLFGQPTSQPATGFAFGQPQQATLGTGTGGLFGAKPATAATGFGFGATSTSTPFGFNTGAQTGFGNTGGLLGGGSLTFGLAQNKPAVSGSSLFGGSNTFGTTGFNFGTATTGQTGLGTGFSGFGTTVAAGQAAADATAAAVAQQNQQQLLQLTSSPYGDSPLFRNLRKDATKREELLKPTSPAAQKAALANGSQFKVGNRPLAKIKPKPLLAGSAGAKGQLFDGLEEDESAFEGETFVPRRSVRKLVIKSSKPNNLSRSSGSPPSFLSVPAAGADNHRDRLSNERPSGVGINGQGSGQLSEGVRQTAGGQLPGPTNFDDTIGELNARNRAGYRDDFRTRDGVVNNDQDTNLDFSHDPLGRQLFSGGHDSSSELDDQASSISESDQPPHPCGVVLRRHGYFTLPGLEELLPEADGRCQVENFVVAREGYGNVLFPGVTDIAGMNLDEIVHFRRKEIDVYPNDDTKPPIGQGLNKRAQVTLDFVWPRDKTTGKSIKDFQRLKDMGYTEYLERASNKIGAKFVEYRSETGSWVFEVKHFSKYGLPDDSDDEDAIVSVPKLPPVLPPGRVPIQPPHDQQRVVNVDDSSAASTVQQAEKYKSAAAADVDSEPKRVGLGGRMMVDEDDSEMPDIMREKFPGVSSAYAYDDVEEDEMLTDMVPGSHHIARSLAVTADQIQIQKASFFADDDGDEYGVFGQKDWSGFGAGAQLKRQSTSAFGGSLSPWSQKSVIKPSDSGMFIGGGDTKQQQQQRGKSSAPDPTGRSRTPLEFETQPVKMPSMHFPTNDQHKLIPSGLDRSKSVPRPVVGTRIQRSVVPLDRSLLLGRHSMIMDAGLMQSRRFRVGWAPSWVMSHLSRLSEEEKGDLSMSVGYSILMDSQSILAARKSLNVSDYRLTRERVSPFCVQSTQDIAVVRNTLVGRLQVQLENSDGGMEHGCPVFTPDDANSLLQGYVKQSHDEPVGSDSTVSASAVWELCYALWGRLDGTVSALDDGSVDEANYVTQQTRREALSCWLTDCTADVILQEVQRAKAKNRDSAACIFSFLSGRMIEEACDHAISVGDLRLALLVSQVIGSEDLRHFMVKQLGSWADTQMDQFVAADRLRVFALLAGTLVWESSNQNINTCASLDWRRCFALHLWYHCLPTATIMDAVRAYDQSYTSRDMASNYAAPPLPLYLEKLGAEVNSSENVQDVCYQLLKLFCDRTQPLHVLLNPPSITDNDLDYSLSWHLMVTLFSLGYNHLDVSRHAYICVSYASQLEALGLWHWAVFVLLHLQEPLNRISAVKQLIERRVTLNDSADVEKEQFLVKSLHIPVEWIHVAKALRAKSEGNRVVEAWHLLRARKWNQAHSLIVNHIAPEAIVNGNEQLMCTTFLQTMSAPEISTQVKDWSTGGGLFLDYGDMLHNFDGFNQGVLNSDVDLESLYVKAVSVAGRINRIQCRTAVDSVCQSTMSRNVAKVMTSLMSFKRDSSQYQPLLEATASHVRSLHLPEDYALEALGHVSHSLFRSLTINY